MSVLLQPEVAVRALELAYQLAHEPRATSGGSEYVDERLGYFESAYRGIVRTMRKVEREVETGDIIG